jgi:hypothetical protein
VNVPAGNDMTNSSRQTMGRKKAAAPPISPAEIAHRAFELFAARGGEHGHDVEDWLRAEQELSLAAPGPRRTASPRRAPRKTVID